MKKWLARIVLGLVLAALGGLIVAASGIIPIKASSGHWPITAWFLNFSMSRSVATHTLGLQAPSLEDTGLVLKGAGHFETGCRPCHGSPDAPRPIIPLQMTPHPPYLPETVSEWEPEELFYIVKHGVKFTGMPAWPAQQREDEVWAVVAFLLTLPDLNAENYRRLVDGRVSSNSASSPVIEDMSEPETELPAIVKDNCARCHGLDGRGRGEGAFPRLAGQRAHYLLASLQAYSQGRRFSGIMQPVAAVLQPEQMQELAAYYEGLQGSVTSEPSGNQLERGAEIAATGIPEQGVPSCADCHGPETFSHNPYYPILAGQSSAYLVSQLKLFKAGQRGGTPFAHLMRRVASGLEPEQMQAVALYYQSLPSPLSVEATEEPVMKR